MNILSGFFICKAGDDMLKREILGRGGIEGNNEIFIGRGETKSENKDKILVRNIDINFLQLECNATDLSDPCLHADIISFLERVKFAAEHETGSKTTSTMDSF